MDHSPLAYVVAALLGIAMSSHAAEAQFQLEPGVVALDSLLRTAGPKWREAHSRHFVLYTERGGLLPLSPVAFLDSLEDAWTHDSSLLGASPLERPAVPVLVTHSAERFPGVLAPSSRGVMQVCSTGDELIILVHNDSIRAFTRHEVMHVVARRMWGPPRAAWVDEGLATMADGRCQSTTVLAVARDLLRVEPQLRAADLPARFAAGAGPVLGRRLSAYALAASMISFIYGHGGSDAVHALWRGKSLPEAPVLSVDSITMAWRQYVEQAAAAAALAGSSLPTRRTACIDSLSALRADV